jgi:CHAT domain-containing protein
MKIRHTSRYKWFSSLLASPSGLVLVVLSVVVVVLAIAGWRRGLFTPEKSQVATGIEALARAYRYRPLEARISGFPYTPRNSLRGGANDVDQDARAQAEKSLLEADAENSTAATRQALGQFHLMSGSPFQAIEHFEAALKQDPNNSSLRNDYGVALLEMGNTPPTNVETDHRLHYLARSLEQFNLGLSVNADNREALHNRALVLDLLNLRQQRNKAWQKYLSVETDPAWAADARMKLDSFSQTDSQLLTQPESLARFLAAALTDNEESAWHELTSNKEMIAERYLPQAVADSFLTASANGDRANAQNLLTALRFAGKLELAKAHDPFVSHMANFYSNVSHEKVQTLGKAYSLLKSGYAAGLNGDYDHKTFKSAQELFARAGDVWNAKICDYWIAYSLSQKLRLEESTKLLKSLADYSKSKEYHWLDGQATCWLANNDTDIGEPSKSIKTYEQALSTATDIDDVYNQQKILSQLGNVYTRLNQPERALQYNWRALQLVDHQSSSVRQTWRIYLYVARALMALNLLEAATEFEEEMLSLALNVIKDPAVTHYSYLYLSQIHGGKKNFPAAFQFAEESRKFAEAVSDSENRYKLSTGALLQLAQLQRQSGSIHDSLNTYTRVIDNSADMKWPLPRLDALKGRLLSYAALKDTGALDAEIPKVINEFETHRARITEDKDRIPFFALQQSTYDLAINHEFAKNDRERALEYSEQSRARSLLQTIKSKTSADVQAILNSTEIKQRLPDDLQVLQYAVLDDKLVIWLITRNSVVSHSSDISANALRALVKQYVDGISAGPGQSEKLRPVSQQLYDTLIKPFGQELDPRKVLCLVPDKTLSYLPFAALISSATQKYLVDEFVLLTAPSLNVLWHYTLNQKNNASQTTESLLVIGNPAFDRREYPGLDDLPAAAREARGIAAMYAGSFPLIGPAAVKPVIEKRLLTADVIHFAGHYETNQVEPLLSKLVLAKEKSSSDTDLTLRELMNLRKLRAKLVVLSACETSGKDYFNGEGLVGIARTFLELEVPLVVASQWSVETESTAKLMLKFHEYRKSGQSSIRALKNAQRAMLSDQNGTFQDPYYWAAFTPLGGYVSY